jgi:transposase
MSKRRQPEEMLPLLKRHEVQVLRNAGHSQSEVARLTGVSLREIRRIDAEDKIAHVDDRAERARRGIGRPSKAEAYRPFVIEQLAEDPERMSLEILRRARIAGFTGGKSAMYELIASVRPPTVRPVVRFEGLAGEFSQHDFGEVDVTFVDGRRKRVHFFASRLKYSRWVEVSLVENQQVEPLVRSLVDHFDAFEGVPLLAVFDRPKTIVLKSKHDGTVAEWNPTFAQAMLELGVGVEVCWPRSGNQKGSVERLVGWVKNSFFKPRRFVDAQDLREQLAAWRVEVNTRIASRATGVTPQARMAEERARLRPLKVRPAELALRFPVVVNATGEVLHEGVAYSMPPESMHLPGTLFLYRDRVRIICGRYATEQRRRRHDEPKKTLPEHRAQMLAAVSGERAKRYFKREQLLALGATATTYLTELVHRRPKTWARDVDTLFELLQLVGDDGLCALLERALEEQVYGAEYIEHFLSGTSAPTPERDSWHSAKNNAGRAPAKGAPPRGPRGKQLAFGFGRAEPRRGGS